MFFVATFWKQTIFLSCASSLRPFETRLCVFIKSIINMLSPLLIIPELHCPLLRKSKRFWELSLQILPPPARIRHCRRHLASPPSPSQPYPRDPRNLNYSLPVALNPKSDICPIQVLTESSCLLEAELLVRPLYGSTCLFVAKSYKTTHDMSHACI